MPEVAVNKYYDPLLPKNEVGLSRQLDAPTPAGDPEPLHDGDQAAVRSKSSPSLRMPDMMLERFSFVNMSAMTGPTRPRPHLRPRRSRRHPPLHPPSPLWAARRSFSRSEEAQQGSAWLLESSTQMPPCRFTARERSRTSRRGLSPLLKHSSSLSSKNSKKVRVLRILLRSGSTRFPVPGPSSSATNRDGSHAFEQRIEPCRRKSAQSRRCPRRRPPNPPPSAPGMGSVGLNIRRTPIAQDPDRRRSIPAFIRHTPSSPNFSRKFVEI